jgi:hypothetical protein
MIKKQRLNFFLTEEEKKEIEKRAKEHGFTSLSEFMRVMLIKGKLEFK